MEFEHGSFRPASPATHVPMRADKPDLWPRRQIEQKRSFLAINLLRKSRDRLRIPRGAIRRPEDTDIERFLLDNVGDGQRQQKDPPGGAAHIERTPVSFGIDHRSFRNEEALHHDAEILAERPRSML